MNKNKEAAKELARRKLASMHLEDFITYQMPSFVVEKFHKDLFNALERIEKGELKNLIVQMPPRSGKSLIISQMFPAYMLGKYPDKEIVCASYSGDLASEFGRKTRDIVLEDSFTRVFPDFKLSDTKKEGGNWETKEHGKYLSVGVSGSLTGKGFDIGIIDDPVKDRQEAESKTVRDATYNWYTSTFSTRKKGGNAATIILMTRWNTDDLVGRIVETQPDKWEILSFPAIDEDNNPICERDGFGVEFYEAMREEVGEMDFAALYQQDPVASSGDVFKAEDFRYFAMSDINPKDFTMAISIDPAFSTKKTSDGTAIVTSAKHKETGEVYVLDVFSEPVLPSESYAYIVSLAEKYKSAGWYLDFISVEEVSLSTKQQEFVAGFSEHLKKNRLFYTVLPFRPVNKGKKEDRTKFKLEPMFNRHALHFRNDQSTNRAWQKLEEQLLKFPVSRHDDLSDCLTQAIYMWDNRGGGLSGPSQAMKAYMKKIQSVKKQ